jgi:hypothetical protein
MFCLLFSLSAFSQEKELNESTSSKKAVEGDTVWVLLNHIKFEKTDQFEQLIHDVLWPIADKMGSVEKEAAQRTRVLHPVKMNKDSTYTYVFIMDPVISKANYKFSYYFKNAYDEVKAKEYIKKLNDCYASPQTCYTVIQSRH